MENIRAPQRSGIGWAIAATLRTPSLLAIGSSLAVAAAAQTSAAGTTDKPQEATPASAAADTVTVTDRRSEGYTAKELSSATGLALSPRETPQSMTVMTRERMDDQNLTAVRQVLDNTPGIYSNSYDTERVLFWSRGFLVDALMYDGLPAVPNFSTGSIDETLDTAPYERIEIIRGATGLMTGTGNPAAAVNLVRKHANSRTATGALELTAGSWSNLRAMIDVQTPLNAEGTVRARFVGVGEDTESYQDLYSKATYVAYGIIDADLSPATRVSFGFDYQNNRPKANTWGSFPMFLADGQRTDWPTSVTTAADWAYWNRKTQTVFAEANHRFDSGWTLRGTVSHRRFTEDLEMLYLYGFPDPATGLGLEPYAYKTQGKITQNELDLQATGPFELGGREHELVIGYNGSRSKNTATVNDPESVLPPTGNFFQWDGSYPRPAFGAAMPLNDIDTNQDAAYAVARFSLADPLKFIAGARYLRWEADSFNLYDNPTNGQYDFSQTIPYAGLIWDFLPEWSAFASYTGIYQPQNARDINGRFLDPIEGRSYEIGVKGEHFNRRLNTALTLFETRQNNVAAPVYDANGAPVLRPDGSSVMAAVDGAKSRGFELEVAGRVTNELQLAFGWTYFSLEDAAGQEMRNFIPRTLVRAFATWEPRQWIERLTLGAGVNWQSGTSATVAAPGPTPADPPTSAVVGQSSFAQVSLLARYQFTPNLSVQFNANNIFDKKFYVLDEFDNTSFGAPANYALTMRVSY